LLSEPLSNDEIAALTKLPNFRIIMDLTLWNSGFYAKFVHLYKYGFIRLLYHINVSDVYH
jgi:hypothetical protein